MHNRIAPLYNVVEQVILDVATPAGRDDARQFATTMAAAALSNRARGNVAIAVAQQAEAVRIFALVAVR